MVISEPAYMVLLLKKVVLVVAAQPAPLVRPSLHDVLILEQSCVSCHMVTHYATSPSINGVIGILRLTLCVPTPNRVVMVTCFVVPPPPY